MKSFNRIALGLMLGSLLFSGCTGMNNWWKREHALLPLKEQYWNGELSQAEYREKKQALIADMERTDYKTPTEHKKALRAALDSHHGIKQEERMDAKEDAAIILEQDNVMIKSVSSKPKTEAQVMGDARAFEAEQAPTNAELDYNMLSNSIKRADEPSSKKAKVVLTSEPARATESAPTATSSQEMITDSNAVKWTKSHDGTVIYEDPKNDELEEQQVK